MKKYVATLGTHCVTTEKALRGVSNTDLRTMGIPSEVITKARQIIGQEYDWGDNDIRPRLYTRTYNESTRI